VSVRELGDLDLFFHSTTDSYVSTPRFVRRSWLAEELDRRLSEAEVRFVLLTASPGAGKSSFIAQLASEHTDWFVYYLRRDQRTPLGDGGAYSLLLRLGYQLAARRRSLFDRARVKIAIEQRIGQAGGRTVGVEIDRLIASPFYDVVLRLTQDIRRADGEVIGLHAGEYTIEPRLIPIEDLQFMALLDPARILEAEEPGARIVILVDALDEATHQAAPNVVDWLTNAPELPANVRLVLTTRSPEGAVAMFCKKQQPYLRKMTIAADDRHVLGEVQEYANGLISIPAVARILETMPEARGFPARAAAVAGGNIGYLAALARGIDNAVAAIEKGLEQSKNQAQALAHEAILARLLTLRELPAEISGLYAFFLNQIRNVVRNRVVPVGRNPETSERLYRSVWLEVYRPVLAILTVAMEPPSSLEMKTLGDISTGLEDITEALENLMQFLEPADRGRYRLYHSTMREFLTDQNTAATAETAELYIDAVEWHRRIGEELRETAENGEIWRDSNSALEQARRSYGRRYYIQHVFEGRDYRALSRAIDGTTYGLGKLEFDPSAFLFVQDLDLARRVAAESDESKADTLAKLPALWKYSLLRCTLTGAQSSVQEATLRALAGISEEQEALRLVRLMPKPETRVHGLIAITEVASQDARKTEFVRKLCRDAITISRRIDEERATVRAGERILKALRFLTIQVGWWDDDVIAEFRGFVDELGDVGYKVRFLAQIAVLWLARDRTRAGELIVRATRLAGTMPESERGQALSYVCHALAEADDGEGAASFLPDIPREDRAEALCAVARSCERARRNDQARTLAAEALALGPPADSKSKRVQFLINVGRTLSELGNREEGKTQLDQAWQIAATASAGSPDTRLACEVATAYHAASLLAQRNRVLAHIIRVCVKEERSRVLQAGYAYVSQLTTVVETLGELGLWKRAARLAEGLRTNDRDIALRAAAQAAYKAKQWDEALRIAREIGVWEPGSPYRVTFTIAAPESDSVDPGPQTVIEICAALAGDGAWERAVAIAEEIDTPQSRANALGAIAENLMFQDKLSEVREVLKRQRSIIRSEAARFSREDLVAACAIMLLRGREWELAAKLVAGAPLQRTRGSRVINEFRKAADWRNVAQIARLIPDVQMKMDALLAVAQRTDIERAAAVELVEEVRTVATASVKRDRLAVAEAFTLLGENARAIEELDLAEREFLAGAHIGFRRARLLGCRSTMPRPAPSKERLLLPGASRNTRRCSRYAQPLMPSTKPETGLQRETFLARPSKHLPRYALIRKGWAR
jgi:hypothetical protein